MHPELVRRLVSAGSPRRGACRVRDRRQFRRDAAVGSTVRCACGATWGSTYAGALLACELLARIELLERRLRRSSIPNGDGGDLMDPNRLTQKTQEALHDAQTKALRYGHTEVDVEHLLLALLEQPDGLVAAPARRAPDVDVDALAAALERAPRGAPAGDRPGRRRARCTSRARSTQLLDDAEQEAERLKDEYVSVEHLLLAMLEPGAERRRAPPASEHGVTRERFLEVLTEVRGSQRVTSATPEAAYEALEKYGRDLVAEARTRQARPGDRPRRGDPPRDPDPLAQDEEQPGADRRPGRRQDRDRRGPRPADRPRRRPRGAARQDDLRARHGLARRRREVPRRVRGAAEGRAPGGQGRRGRGSSSFIDELHTVVGAGAAEGAMDAGNMLKPMLARGELHCIGATTLDEYRKHIEKDAALERRFQPVVVDEPTVEDTISILRGLRERFEVHHGVRIQDAALVAAATLSHRYITDRFLPDKAIDLVDEACAVIRTEIDSMPQELDAITRRVMQLEIEEAALEQGERRGEPGAPRGAAQGAGRPARAGRRDDRPVGGRAPGDPAGCRRCARSSSRCAARSRRPSARYDLNRAAELRHGRLPELERRLRGRGGAPEPRSRAARGCCARRSPRTRSPRSSRAGPGIPVARLIEGEREKLLRLDEVLHERVIGQDEAVQLVADAVIRARAGIKDPRRPIGSFIFLGPTGVGKTELSRALAEALFDSEDNIVRLDMSEYQERHTVSRLMGAPPGYVGYEEGGQLTEAVRRKPYSVVLFDEIEKAHPDVFNTLLQILDDGRLTDAQGRTVDFRNTVDHHDLEHRLAVPARRASPTTARSPRTPATA